MERQKFTRMMDLSERMYLRRGGEDEGEVRVMDMCGEEYRQARRRKKSICGRCDVISLILPSVKYAPSPPPPAKKIINHA